MPLNRDQLNAALVAAHNAGQTDHARILAQAIRDLDASGTVPVAPTMGAKLSQEMEHKQFTSPFAPDVPKTLVPGGEFILNQAKQGLANLGGILFDVPEPGVFQADTSDPSQVPQVTALQKSTQHLENMMGVRPNLTTDSLSARIAGRGLEYGISGAPLAPFGPVAYGVSTVGGAVGDVVGEDIAGDKGRMIGGFAGSMLTPALVVNGIVSGLKWGKRTATDAAKIARRASTTEGRNALQGELQTAYQPFSNEAEEKLTQLARGSAARRLALAVQSNPQSDETIRAFNVYLDEVEKITGIRPEVSLADVLQHPDLLKGQQLHGSASIEDLNAAQLRRNLNEQNLNTARQTVTGQGSPENVLDAAATGVDNKTAALLSEKESLTQRLDDTLELTRKQIDPAASGAQIRNLIDAERRGVKGQFDATFGTFRKEAQGARFDVTPLVSKVRSLAEDLKALLDPKEHPTLLRNIDRISERWAEGGQPPGVIQDVSGARLIPGNDATGYTASLEDVWDNLQTLTAEISDLQTRVRANPNAIRKLGEVVDVVLDDVMAHGAKNAESALLADKLKDLRTQYRMDYIQRFKIGQNKALGVKSPYDDMLVSDQNVVKQYLSDDSNFGRLIAAVGDNPTAMQLTDDAIVSFYASKVTPNNTNFRSGNHNSFMQRYGKTLQKYRPALYDRLNTTGVTAEEIGRNLKRVAKEQAAVTRSNLIPLLQNQDIEGVIEKALLGPKEMTEIMKLTGVKNRPDLQSVILNHLTTNLPEGRTIASRLSDPKVERSLRVLLGSNYDKTVGQIKAISAVWEIMENPHTYQLNPSAYNEGKIRQFLRRNGVPYVQVASALRSVGRRPGSGGWFATILGGQVVNATVEQRLGIQMRDLQSQILNNPEARNAILKSWSTGNTKAVDTSELLTMIRNGVASATKSTVKSTAIRTGVPFATWSGQTEDQTRQNLQQTLAP